MKQLKSINFIKSDSSSKNAGGLHKRRKSGVVAAAALGLTFMAAQSVALGNEWRSHGHGHGQGYGQANGYANNYQRNYGRVIDVHPIYHKVRLKKPQRHCTTQYQQHYSTGIQGNYSGSYQNDYNYGNKRNKRKRGNNVVAPLAGAIVGGAIGNQLSRSSRGHRGNLGATIAGAVIGSVIAGSAADSSFRKRRSRGHVRDRFQHHNDYGQTQHYSDRTPSRGHLTSRPVEHCSTRYVTYTEDRLQGYKVSYRYHGRIYSIRTQKHPGKRIRVGRNGRPRY